MINQTSFTFHCDECENKIEIDTTVVLVKGVNTVILTGVSGVVAGAPIKKMSIADYIIYYPNQPPRVATKQSDTWFQNMRTDEAVSSVIEVPGTRHEVLDSWRTRGQG